MSYTIVNYTLEEISEYVKFYHAELRKTKFANTYMIKFNPETLSSDVGINHLRGLIFNHVTKQIYSLTFPVPLEVKDLQDEKIQQVAEHIKTKKYQVYEAIDGPLLRLWYLPEENHWVLSTNGVEDANDAYWMNNISFAEQFGSAVPDLDWDTLNKDYVYLFSICHPLNIIVVNHLIPKAYHVTTYDRRTMCEVQCDIGINHPPHFPYEVDEVTNITLNHPDTQVISAGYMIVQEPDTQGMVHRYRFENANYTKARALRGDSNNINYILMTHWLKKDPTDFLIFLKYYPIYKTDADWLEEHINITLHQLLDEYLTRYQHKHFVVIHQRHHHFINDLHKQVYLPQLKGKRQSMQYENVLEYFWSLSPDKALYYLNVHEL